MQEFRVLKCSECQSFQVDIAKKDKKWSCKSCSYKQSVKVVYFNSQSAKDCREKVEELRQNAIETEKLKMGRRLEVDAGDCGEVSSRLTARVSELKPEETSNKWVQFSRTIDLKPQDVKKGAHSQKLDYVTNIRQKPQALITSNKWESSSFNQPTVNSSSYSIHHQPNPTQIYKLVDYHKKPSRNNFKQGPASTFIEPPQKKLKAVVDEFDDDFFLSQDDWNVLDSLK